jgi:ABC-type uncharacterized transport system fused permease/ATPase subunit
MNRIIHFVGAFLVGYAALSTWAAIEANQEIGRLEADNATLQAAYEYSANRYNSLNTVTAKQQKDQRRERERLQNQIDALRTTEADECADTPAPADVVGLLGAGGSAGAEYPPAGAD